MARAQIQINGDQTRNMKTKRIEILAKVFLQLAMSDEENTHTEMDQFGYFTEGSSGLSIVKKSDGRE